MANLFNLVAINSLNTRRQKTIKVSAAPLAGNYTPGGLALDLTTITDPSFRGSCFPGMVPQSIQVENAPAGYSAEIVAGSGTTLATAFALKIYTAPNVEMTAIAIPANLVADFFLLALLGPNWGF
jgi:hypothetical protein